MTSNQPDDYQVQRRTVLAGGMSLAVAGCLGDIQLGGDEETTPTSENTTNTSDPDSNDVSFPEGITEEGITEELIMTHRNALSGKRYERKVEYGSFRYEFVVDGTEVREKHWSSGPGWMFDAYTTDRFESAIARAEGDDGSVVYTDAAQPRNIERATPELGRQLGIGDYRPVDVTAGETPEETRIVLQADDLAPDADQHSGANLGDNYAGEATVRGDGIVLNLESREDSENRTRMFDMAVSELDEATPEPPAWEDSVADRTPQFEAVRNGEVLTVRKVDGPAITMPITIGFLDEQDGHPQREVVVRDGLSETPVYIAVAAGGPGLEVFDTAPEDTDPLPEVSYLQLDGYGVRLGVINPT